MIFPLFSSLILSFSFLFVSTGFDFYWHAISYYFDPNLNYSNNFFDIFYFPRYILLSEMYLFFSYIGVPLGYVVFLMISFLTFDFFKSIWNRGGVKFDSVVMICFFSILIFFYSGLSISLAFLICFHVTGRKGYMYGGFFHPIGFFLYCVYFLFFNKGFFSFLIKCFFVFLYFYIYNEDDVSVRYSINYDFLINRYDLLFLKLNEIVIFFVLFILVFSLKRHLSKLSFKREEFFLIFNFSLAFFVFIVVPVFMSDRSTPFNCILLQYCDPSIEISWQGRTNESFEKTFYLRSKEW